ncbi:uncharacterized protein F4807DRAFT_260946 [Annulohypoxylon truncatum]|uniref:uncharacterized protein n=1 Tax=Annulohypoxylon truncatum TaxID=327061 RepID=UPI0020076B24|nr:uncharacterized protein F4807DRAFT_260946 [Annulohypoxylon truncatum]KAI1213333.1 hypothetical protein F4807DRAFT_260946 [Annulohypoxylon truncatum]
MSDFEQEGENIGAFSRNQIKFLVENQTAFELEAEGCFADWGDFAEPPSTIKPYSSGSGGHVISSRSPFTGSAGMSGYAVKSGSEALYLRFLGSNPYMSAKDNYCTSAVLTRDANIGQGDYNWLYYREEKDDSKSFNGGTLTVTSNIGQADDCVAIFTVTFEE